MLKLVVGLILLSLVVLSVRIFRRPGIAVALGWSMIALESVVQQGNSFLLRNATFMNYAIAALIAVAAAFAILKNKFRVRIPLPAILYAAMLGVTSISYFWSESPSDTYANLMKNLPYVFTFGFLIPICACDEKQLNTAIRVLIYFGALVALGTAISSVGRRGIILTTQNGVAVEANPLASSSFAAYVGIAALFSVWGGKIFSPKPLIKIAIVGIATIAIVNSGSRGQLLAFALVCIAWLPVMARASVKRSTIFAIMAAVLLSFFAVWMIDQLGWTERWDSRSMMKAQSGRIEMWKFMVNTNFEKGPIAWLFGLGSSASFKYFGNYPHNIFAEAFSELGLVGLVLLLAILFIVFRDGLRLMRTNQLSQETRVNFAILMAFFSFNLIVAMKQGSLLTSSLSVFTIAMTISWLSSHLSSKTSSSYSLNPKARMVVYPSTNQVRS
jgi:O-antigen ligase